MIRITIEKDRFGLGAKITYLGEITIANTGKPTSRSRHNYTAWFRDRKGRVFRKVKINNWPRDSRSIWKLLQEVLNGSNEA